MRGDNEAFLAAFHIECQNRCPELGMYARMRSPLGRNLFTELRVLKTTVLQKHETPAHGDSFH